MPNDHTASRATARLAACAAIASGLLAAAPVFAFKDVGPASAACDTHAKGSAGWSACVGAASARSSDAELFYAGYWLARAGRYEEALGYLRQARTPDEKVLTYIGFATRKLGRTDEALEYYNRALGLNPDYSVARAYMGEGFLARGEAGKARDQLAEIARRSGTASAEYAELAGHIARFEQGLPPQG